MSETHDAPLADALDRLKHVPANQLTVGATASADNAGIGGTFSRTVGKGKTLTVSGGVERKRGWGVAGLFQWDF